tara:strand:- start:78 stop:482 length:405 start_codon:yes stop_codon:yes gene_type:complete
MSRIHSTLLTGTMNATNSMQRINLGAANTGNVFSFGHAGTINSLELHFTSINSATAIAKMTLSWVNADNNYIVNRATSASIEIDADTATNGSYEVSVSKEFNGVPANATGIWLGIQLDAGTATVNVNLHVRGHA